MFNEGKAIIKWPEDFKEKNMKRDSFTLNEGKAIIEWPEDMCQSSFEDFTDFLLLIHKKIRRDVEGLSLPVINAKTGGRSQGETVEMDE